MTASKTPSLPSRRPSRERPLAPRAFSNGVVSYAHGWERACHELVIKLGLTAKHLRRGRLLYRLDADTVVPAKSKLPVDHVFTVQDVWEKERWWYAWVVDDDGIVHDPSEPFQDMDKMPPHAERVLQEFDPLVQRVLGNKIVNSWRYHCTLVSMFDRDDVRELDSLEFRPWCDVLMVPLMDRAGVTIPKTTTTDDGKVVATKDIAREELVAAYPVCMVASINSLLREFSLQEDSFIRSGWPHLPDDPVDLSEAPARLLMENSFDIARVDEAQPVMAVSGSLHKQDTIYNGHMIRQTLEDDLPNVRRILVQNPEGACLHIFVVAERDIAADEEIIAIPDFVTTKSVNRLLREKRGLDAAPRQRALALTNMKLLLEF
nr:hypothetical protein TetV2_00416 [Oceanusvirus sp.]